MGSSSVIRLPTRNQDLDRLRFRVRELKVSTENDCREISFSQSNKERGQDGALGEWVQLFSFLLDPFGGPDYHGILTLRSEIVYDKT